MVIKVHFDPFRGTSYRTPSIEVARRLGDPAALIADSGRIHNELGWRPIYSNLKPTAFLIHVHETSWKWNYSIATDLLGILALPLS